jgi:serine/threonine protein kinase/WD40 repeat protein
VSDSPPESDATWHLTVDLLVEYDLAKETGTQTQPLRPDGPLDEAAIACVDLLHRAWPSSSGALGPRNLPAATVLGDFRLVREIGRGGMGVVYEAEQLSLARRVAVKVLPHAALLSAGRLARFELEARTAATLEHPHIVPIFSVGREHNVHYYAMKLIRGVSLADLYLYRSSFAAGGRGANGDTGGAKNEELGNARDALLRSIGSEPSDVVRYFDAIVEWGIQAAEALQFSHERGVVHRDIKPANLLIDQSRTLWIADFGLARLNDDSGATFTGEVVGTLRYTSPERLQGGPGANQQVDVYSLGVTLYEMLALQPAFDEGDRPYLLRQIIEHDPRPLRQVDPRIPTDLETIIAKAMEKDPAQRYLSAGEFAADLRRYATHQPIQAKRATIAHRVSKWTKRHKTLARAFLIFGGLLLLLLGVSSFLIQRSLRDTSDLLYAADVSAAYSAWGRGATAEASDILARQLPGRWQTDRRGLEWRLLQTAIEPAERIELLAHDGSVNELAVFPDQRRLASVGDDGTLRIWEVPSGKLLRTVNVCNEPLHSVAVSSNGKLAAVGSTSGYLYDVENDIPPEEVVRSEYTIESLAFSRDGQTLFAGARYHELMAVTLQDLQVTKIATDSRVESLEVLPDGTLLAPNRRPGSGDQPAGVIEFIDPSSLKAIREIDSSRISRTQSQLTVARASRCGEYVLTGETHGSTAYLFETQSGKKVAQTPMSRVRLTDVAIAGDGTCLGMGYRDGVCEVSSIQWLPDGEVLINQRPQIVHAHEGELLSMKFIGSSLLATAGKDGAIRLWKLPRHQSPSMQCGETSLTGVSLSPDGKHVAYASLKGYGAIDVESGSTAYRWRQRGTAFLDPVWSPRSDQFSVVALDNALLVTVDLTAAEARTASLREQPAKIAYSPHGDALALAGPAYLSIRNAKTGAETRCADIRPGNALSVCYSDDGELIAYGNDLGCVNVVRSSDCSQAVQFSSPVEVDVVRFSPDSHLLASGHRDGVVRLWNLRQGKLVAEFRGHEMGVADLRFSTDGATLASATQTGIVRLWSVKHARLFGVLFDPAWNGVKVGKCSLHLTSSGDQLASGYWNKPDDFADLMLWRAEVE